MQVAREAGQEGEDGEEGENEEVYIQNEGSTWASISNAHAQRPIESSYHAPIAIIASLVVDSDAVLLLHLIEAFTSGSYCRWDWQLLWKLLGMRRFVFLLGNSHSQNSLYEVSEQIVGSHTQCRSHKLVFRDCLSSYFLDGSSPFGI